MTSRPSGSRRDDGELDVVVDQKRGVDQLAIDAAGQRSAGQPAPMLCATSATLTARSKLRWLHPAG